MVLLERAAHLGVRGLILGESRVIPDRFWQVSLLRFGYAIEPVAERPEVAAMFLELSAMYLLERHREREARMASGRVHHLVAFRDRTGRRGDPGADLGRVEHLDPAPGTEQHGGRLVRPVQPQPKP